MKASEFKKLIREEVRRALKENTQLMTNPEVKAKVEMVIKTLQSIDIDGETMQYILEKVGMGEQMQHQLTPGGIREAATIDSTPLGDPKVKDALKKLLNARKRNSEDETTHDQMEQYLIQLFTKMKLQDPESFASYMMEDEEFATGTVDGMISSIEFALEDEEAM